MDYFLELFIIGLSLGSVYALVALGYSIVYGVLKVINFSHGEVYAVGAYCGYVLVAHIGLNFVASFIISAIFCGIFIWIVDIFLFRRVKASATVSLLMLHIGLSVAIRAVLSLIFGEKSLVLRHSVPEFWFDPFLGLQPVLNIHFILFLISAFLFLALFIFFKKTKTGLTIIAVSSNVEHAQALGIKVTTIVTLSYVIGASLAGLIAPLGAALTGLTPQIGFMLGIKAFTASVIGGIGRPIGALWGGVTIGLVESFVGGCFGSSYREYAIILVLALVLFVFPNGILRNSRKLEVNR